MGRGVAHLELLLKPCELGLGNFLSVCRIVRHEHQLLVVTVLGAQCALDRRQLIVKANPLFLQPLDYLLVSAPLMVHTADVF